LQNLNNYDLACLMQFISRYGENMQQNTVTKNNKNINQFLNGRIDITIFTKTGKIQSKNIKNLSSFLKKQSSTIR
tara:strand:+ start:620 stop:844 length:225 start_codon:yes stop_codon:yes gene_type:complete